MRSDACLFIRDSAAAAAAAAGGQGDGEISPSLCCFFFPRLNIENIALMQQAKGKNKREKRKKKGNKDGGGGVQAKEHLDLLLSRRKALGVIRSRLK